METRVPPAGLALRPGATLAHPRAPVTWPVQHLPPAPHTILCPTVLQGPTGTLHRARVTQVRQLRTWSRAGAFPLLPQRAVAYLTLPPATALQEGCSWVPTALLLASTSSGGWPCSSRPTPGLGRAPLSILPWWERWGPHCRHRIPGPIHIVMGVVVLPERPGSTSRTKSSWPTPPPYLSPPPKCSAGMEQVMPLRSPKDQGLRHHLPHAHSTCTPPNRLGHPQTTTPPAGAPLGPSQGSQGPSLFLGGLTTSWRSPGGVSAAAAAGPGCKWGGGHVTGRGAGRRASLHPSCLLPLLTPQLSQQPRAFVPDGR